MNSEYKLSDLKTIPNILSIARLIIIPIFVSMYLKAETAMDYQVVAIIVFVSGLTDFVDGFIARKFSQITEIGKVLDPVADKLTQFAIIICLVSRYELMKPLLVLFVVKECMMGILGLYFMKNRKQKLDGAQWFGKVSTAVFYAGSIILFFFYDLDTLIVNTLIVIIALFLFISMINYAQTYYKMTTQE